MSLKLCPFCGNTASIRDREEPKCYEPNYYYIGYEIMCDFCPAYIIIYDEGDGYNKSRKKTKKIAIDAWNRRV